MGTRASPSILIRGLSWFLSCFQQWFDGFKRFKRFKRFKGFDGFKRFKRFKGSF